MKRSTAHVAKAFLRHWVLVYGPPVNPLLDSGLELVAWFFQDFHRIINVKSLFTINYHSQRNGKVEWLNHTLLLKLRGYTVWHKRTWNLFPDTFTYLYRTQPHRFTNLYLLSRSLPPVALAFQPMVDGFPSPTNHYIQRKNWLATVVPFVTLSMAHSERAYKQNFACLDPLISYILWERTVSLRL